MPSDHTLGPVGQIPPGEGRTFEVGGGRRVAVFRLHDGGVVATQAECPHRGGPLADGLLGGSVVLCPLHDRGFDVRTGAPAADTDCTLRTYPVRTTDGGEMVLSLD
jgi:nitrite reductase (NADH) small subunit